MKKAVIDLGTNTFHLLIGDENQVIFRKSTAVKLGKGGINKDELQSDAMERAIVALKDYSEIIQQHEIPPYMVFASGTSAIRNAKNRNEFIAMVLESTNIHIYVIDGEREAELIYKGVKKAVEINSNAMIVDIGGGSVEFIICNHEGPLWKRSFEIGGQRLMELFMKTDPISSSAVNSMNDYFREKLLPLANACHQYQPKEMIGSSGSFDTINDIYWMKTKGALPSPENIAFDLPIKSFYEIYEEFLFKNRDERMAIPGMIELRVEMIVVASCLIRYLIQTFEISILKVSNYALKEGVLSEVFDEQ
ncbi:exopolyphosphatase / guanosine-5'-triphosphate,3'-diphosphate pyrophosphatase [Spirosomataceae bacterium TFI 002]|nr:exopolyphosphatase / guanosine-5'-triphosphate,3'-diphosphate pyrophosphatase [Spirosomataceae bacterium TFI 002]